MRYQGGMRIIVWKKESRGTRNFAPFAMFEKNEYTHLKTVESVIK